LDGISNGPSLESMITASMVQTQQGAKTDAQTAMLGRTIKAQSDIVTQLMKGMGIGNHIDAIA
jgi:hypothetical protein